MEMPDYNCFNKGTFNFEKIGFESEYNHSNRFHQSMKKKLSKFLNKLEFHKAESNFFLFIKNRDLYQVLDNSQWKREVQTIIQENLILIKRPFKF